jgi:hypothetical protein
MNYSSGVRPLPVCSPSEEGVNTVRIVKVAALAALSIVVLFGTGSTASAWTPPIGIPAPPFGIDETAGPYTHYVDNSVACNDANNAGRGSATSPRCTIPTTLAAGSVVEVHGGPYIYNTSGPNAFVASGTANAIVYVRGIADGSGNKPVIQGPGTWQQGYSNRSFRMNGTYYIVEGFRFGNGTTLNVDIGGSYGVIRNSEFVNLQTPPDAQGRQYGAALGPVNGAGGEYFLIYNNVFRDNGNYLSTSDNKVQGIKFGGKAGVPGSAYVWILNNTFYHNGQAMQHGDDCIGTMVNGACQPDVSAFPNHFYIGFNLMHDDREVGLALKMVQDFIVSQNEAYNYIDLPLGADCTTSPMITAFNVGRFASDRVWVLFNKIHDASIGIRSNGQLDGSTGPTPVFPTVYAIGNLLYNIRGTNSSTGANCTPYAPANPYSSGAAVLGWENNRVYVVDNTIVNSSKGISFYSGGYYEVTGNLIANTGDPMNFVPTNWGTNKYDYNFYDSTARLAYGSTTPIISLSQVQAAGQEAHSRQGSALVDANFRPASGSPAIDTSIRSTVYDTFFSLYGISIAKDFQGGIRPQGAAWDIGANEFASGVGSPPPAPSGLIVK